VQAAVIKPAEVLVPFRMVAVAVDSEPLAGIARCIGIRHGLAWLRAAARIIWL